MLKIAELQAFYGNLQALSNIDLQVKKGQIVSIIGANGAGKSTLLKSISGLISKKKGTISFENNNIATKSTNKIVKSGISHVLEGRQLFSHLTVTDNLNLGSFFYYKRQNIPEIKEQLEKIYTLFPILKDRSKQIAGTLSGGEQQMLAIGRALMAKPKLLLLDEPSLGLAPKIVQNIFSTIEKLNKGGTTILLVEQNAKLALGLSDYAYVMETGKILLNGKGKELLSNDKIQKAYLGSL